MSRAASVLRTAAAAWFLTAVAGQLMFVIYLGGFYGAAAARGDFAAGEDVLQNGLVAGDAIGNTTLAAHLLLAFVITVSGPLQLIPQIRRRAPAFHRWNGRVYMLTAFTVSLGGLYLIWVRGTPAAGGPLNWIALSINAVLIMICAALAWRFALARDIKRHRQWALRLFLVVSGVWFLRIGVMLWVLLNGGPAGLGDDLSGPAGVTLSFAQYIVPLAVLQIYLRAQTSPQVVFRYAAASLLAVATAATGAGSVMAAMGMWLPHIGA
jgi:hypothetical protein